MEFNDQEFIQTLEALATEDGKTPEQFIIDLVKHEDSERHVHWNRKKQKFERGKCARKKCAELESEGE